MSAGLIAGFPYAALRVRRRLAAQPSAKAASDIVAGSGTGLCAFRFTLVNLLISALAKMSAAEKKTRLPVELPPP